MNCTVTRKEDVNVSVWSGGSTAQLFIYPAGASYANRDFVARISSATVEEESSAFTHLPGYHRILMPLNAPIRLTHRGRGEVLANPMETVEFEGGWHTVSHGVCTDLGVMLAPGWQGKMEALGGGTRDSGPGFTGVYALGDQVEVRVREKGGFSPDVQKILAQGDFLLLESQTAAELALKSSASNSAVLIWIFRGC